MASHAWNEPHASGWWLLVGRRCIRLLQRLPSSRFASRLLQAMVGTPLLLLPGNRACLLDVLGKSPHGTVCRLPSSGSAMTFCILDMQICGWPAPTHPSIHSTRNTCLRLPSAQSWPRTRPCASPWPTDHSPWQTNILAYEMEQWLRQHMPGMKSHKW